MIECPNCNGTSIVVVSDPQERGPMIEIECRDCWHVFEADYHDAGERQI